MGPAKKGPGSRNRGTSAIGTGGYRAAELVKSGAGIDVAIIPYKGTAPVMTDLLGGHIPIAFGVLPPALGNIASGNLRAVAVTSKKRSSLAPEIPTMTELGMPGLNFGAWWGMWGPPGLPAELTRTINGWVNEAVKSLAAEGRLSALGIESFAESPQFFAKHIAEDYERSSKLLAAANFKPE